MRRLDGGLIAGHARILAARQPGIAEIPVMVAAGWSEAQKRAYVLADNQLAITGSGWDPELRHGGGRRAGRSAALEDHVHRHLRVRLGDLRPGGVPMTPERITALIAQYGQPVTLQRLTGTTTQVRHDVVCRMSSARPSCGATSPTS